MWKVEYSSFFVCLEDEAGKRELLFDATDLYQNHSAMALYSPEQDTGNTFIFKSPLYEELVSCLLGLRMMAWQAGLALLLRQLLTKYRSWRVACVDASENRAVELLRTWLARANQESSLLELSQAEGAEALCARQGETGCNLVLLDGAGAAPKPDIMLYEIASLQPGGRVFLFSECCDWLKECTARVQPQAAYAMQDGSGLLVYHSARSLRRQELRFPYMRGRADFIRQVKELMMVLEQKTEALASAIGRINELECLARELFPYLAGLELKYLLNETKRCLIDLHLGYGEEEAWGGLYSCLEKLKDEVLAEEEA